MSENAITYSAAKSTIRFYGVLFSCACLYAWMVYREFGAKIIIRAMEAMGCDSPHPMALRILSALFSYALVRFLWLAAAEHVYRPIPAQKALERIDTFTKANACNRNKPA